MASQSYNANSSEKNESSYVVTTTDDISEKTVEMEMITPLGSDNANMGLFTNDPIDNGLYPTRQQRQASPNNVPSYMAPTKSAKAKVRSQGPVKQQSPYTPQWNTSTKRGSVTGSGCDSSSSGGGVATYQALRSPSPKGIGVRGQSRRIGGFSPDFNGCEDWTPPFGGHGWRHDLG